MYKSFVHEWLDRIWNRGEVDAVPRLMASDGVIHDLAQDGKDSVGPAAFLAFYHQFRDAFSGMHVEVCETGADGDLAFGRFTVTAIHTGHTLGFAATNKRVAFAGMALARLKDGKLVEGWNVWDAARMREQLGFQAVAPGD